MNPRQPEGDDGVSPDVNGVTSARQFHRPTAQGQCSSSPMPLKRLELMPNVELSPFCEPPKVMYEGYNLFQADPIPGEKASWTKVERTLLSMTQEDFCRKAQKRAKRISAAQQYQSLSEIRQAHVNQLIAERRSLNSAVEWSCVYAKEHEKPSEARNALRNNYKVVFMEVILMQRPYATKTHSRTPMGDLVDLGFHFRPIRKKRTSDQVDHGQFKSDVGVNTRHERSVPSSDATVLKRSMSSDFLIGHPAFRNIRIARVTSQRRT